jgi:hypothetical protein
VDFGKTPSIILYLCYNLSDISGLGENKSVTVSRCHNIKDFSSLKDVQKVTIEWCNGFTNGEEVENVRYLTIDYCQDFTDPSALGRVYHLKLSTWVESFEGLGNVPIFECHFDIFDGKDSSDADYLPHLGGERNKITIFPLWVFPTFHDDFPSLDGYDVCYDFYDDPDDIAVVYCPCSENDRNDREEEDVAVEDSDPTNIESLMRTGKQKVTLIRKTINEET